MLLQSQHLWIWAQEPRGVSSPPARHLLHLWSSTADCWGFVLLVGFSLGDLLDKCTQLICRAMFSPHPACVCVCVCVSCTMRHGSLFPNQRWNSCPLHWESKSESRSVISDSLRPHGLYSPWNSPGQNTGLDSLSLLQEIFLTQGSNPGLLHCRQILYQLSCQGSPREHGVSS